LENKVVIATDRFGFGPFKEKRQYCTANQESRCYYIAMLNNICDDVTHFKVLFKKTDISSSSVLDVSKLFFEYRESVLGTCEVGCSL
jgi:hypothetical protein